MGRQLVVVLFTIASTFGASAAASAMSIAATQDTFVNGRNPAANYAASPVVRVRQWGPNKGFVVFNLTGLGAIDTAELTLPIIAVLNAGSVAVHAVAEPWVDNEVTFDRAPAYAATAAATLVIEAGAAGTTSVVDLTALAQSWLGGAANFGIALVPVDGANVTFGSLEGGAPATLDTTSADPCSPGTLLNPYTNECAPITDISDGFGATQSLGLLPDRHDFPAAADVAIDALEDVPVPGGVGSGIRFPRGELGVRSQAILHTRMFAQPAGVDSPRSDWWLMTPATNRTDSATEFVGIYASHLPDGWFGIFGRPCSVAYPCPDGDISNGWQSGWDQRFSDAVCNLMDFVDAGGHAQQILHYANETTQLDTEAPPLWRNAIYLWNACDNGWDLIWRHLYREEKRDCAVAGCSSWGPILETTGTQGEINELGFEDTLLLHDGVWSVFEPPETTFTQPIDPWQLSHLTPNSGFGVGNRFSSVGPAAVTAGADAHVNARFPTTSYGSAPALSVASWAPKIALVRFDLDDLDGLAFASATLRAKVAWLRRAGTVSLHLASEPWDEDTVSYNALPAYAPIASALLEVNAGDLNEWVTVDLTDAVRQWTSGTHANHGLVVIAAPLTNLKLRAREHEDGDAMELMFDY